MSISDSDLIWTLIQTLSWVSFFVIGVALVFLIFRHQQTRGVYYAFIALALALFTPSAYLHLSDTAVVLLLVVSPLAIAVLLCAFVRKLTPPATGRGTHLFRNAAGAIVLVTVIMAPINADTAVLQQAIWVSLFTAPALAAVTLVVWFVHPRVHQMPPLHILGAAAGILFTIFALVTVTSRLYAYRGGHFLFSMTWLFNLTRCLIYVGCAAAVANRFPGTRHGRLGVGAFALFSLVSLFWHVSLLIRPLVIFGGWTLVMPLFMDAGAWFLLTVFLAMLPQSQLAKVNMRLEAWRFRGTLGLVASVLSFFALLARLSMFGHEDIAETILAGVFIAIVVAVVVIGALTSLSEDSAGTYTTKSCGACNKTLSPSITVGDACPHCGVRFGGIRTIDLT